MILEELIGYWVALVSSFLGRTPTISRQSLQKEHALISVQIQNSWSSPALSATHALVSFLHQLISLSDIPNQSARILLLDFTKAFNRINHHFLIINQNRRSEHRPNPYCMGKKFPHWTKAARKNWEICFQPGTRKWRCPQATVLGPISFIIMIYDLLMEYQAR